MEILASFAGCAPNPVDDSLAPPQSYRYSYRTASLDLSMNAQCTVFAIHNYDGTLHATVVLVYVTFYHSN